MKKVYPHITRIAGAGAVVITLALASNAWSQKKSATASNEPAYYTPATTPIFNPFPNVTDKKRWLVRNLGPVGIGIMLVRPGMTM